VHNKINNIKKLCEALPQVFKVVLVVKGQRAGKGHILDQTTYGTLEAQKAECPLEA